MRPRAARDLAAEAQEHAAIRATFVKHALTRLPLIGVLVITINLFVQVRGDVGLAVAVAQNLTFGGLLVVVLLNLAIYIMVGIMVAAMPLVFDSEYNFWTRVVGTAVVVLLGAVIFSTAPWVLLVGLVVVFVVVGIIVLQGRRKPAAPLTPETVKTALQQAAPPLDSALRSLWAEGRAMLRLVSPGSAPLTPVERAIEPEPEPKAFAAVAEEWNARSAEISEPRKKSITRLAFVGIIGFIALFGVNILTQPIRFAPLELVSINGGEARPGFVLLQGSGGVFVPDPFGTAQFIFAADITSRELCDDTPQWWSVSVMDVLAPGEMSGPDCSKLGAR
ncbi:hypothetical protein N1027_09850 [Herbiconiux sp. CPCC 205763]|uniref:Uncharacterized protein n=1 Tax=Herbiconiux aconitum TaxID=2970913 RepID=A0ABT2GT03_9MICO|nr:hypothetical protein [Herbiconiux aconitum]MCS5718440.1 hypothetical protein [Herbiconiux aconitum]